MKKVLFFILCLFCFNVSAQEFYLQNEIIRFDKIEDYDLQGFTVTDKYIVAFLINDRDTESIIKVFDINTYQELNIIYTHSLGHANDVTYNEKTDLIYVIRNNSNVINLYDADTMEYHGEIAIELPIRSLTYIPDRDIYAVRLITTGYFLDSDFSLYNTMPFIVGMNIEIDTCRQGWTYYNNYIYYSNWSWLRKGGDGTNHIIIYDLEGNKVDELVTQGDIGELEDVAFYNNKMILGINAYDDQILFYLEDIPPIDETYKKEKDEIVELEEKKQKIDKILIEKILIALVLLGYVILLSYSLKSRLKKRLK